MRLQSDPTGLDELCVEPRSARYGIIPVAEGFDWADIVKQAGLDADLFPLYLVVFRSQRKPDADEALLIEADEKAHQAARRSTALIHYFRGELDSDGNTLSFCLWSDREEARKASATPDHIAAMRLTMNMYNHYNLERYWVDNHGELTPVTK